MNARLLSISLAVTALLTWPLYGNIPGGGTGAGPSVTVTDNGATVTLANGIVSVVCIKSSATITQINYTYNNGGSTVTNQLLSGGFDDGKLYWETGGFGTGNFTYSLVADPSGNGGDYAEIGLVSTSTTNGAMEVHFSMLRGSTGFYVTPIWSHRTADVAMSMGETRDNIYAGSIFNWMSVDAARNRFMEVQPGTAGVGVFGAPVEVSLWTNGIYSGQYEDKYKYSADFGVQRVWGWSSVGPGGANVGLWNVAPGAEYHPAGPMKRELMEHIGTTILHMHNGSHYGLGFDGSWNAGEVWTKVYGPYFIYCNNITNSITTTNQAAQDLYTDALAQSAAEQTAWPYSWFANANYTPASGRGTVTGQIVINDEYNPNASAAGLWVGVVQQPITTDAVYDFQQWVKPYQFWVKSDTNGNFTIPNVIAGANYTFYAFGPGAAGTFQSKAQTGGSAPNELDIPSLPFSVTVTAGATNNLGAVTWTPRRVGPTVFEIGYPDRTGAKFRHGDDWWVGDIGPNPSNPLPIWSKFLEYPFDFPSGPNYVVGRSRWPTDWNFVQPIVTDSHGNYNGSTSTITFSLPSTPVSGAQASLYIALSSDFQGQLTISVDGSAVSTYSPAYSDSKHESDTTIREGIHGIFTDNRVSFSGSLLHQGLNTITINMGQGGYFANHAMYDYIRLELTGYVPPAPASTAAYAGNHCNLVCWPVTPGAVSYNILRTTTSGSGYFSVTNGVVGPICGSGPVDAMYLDTNVVNGTEYYYVVQSANSAGTSTNSPESPGTTPSDSGPTSPPAAPGGLAATPGDSQVALSWMPSTGASIYTVQRSTLVANGGGAYVTLGTVTLDNSMTGTTYTDTSPTDGGIYSYTVTATGPAGSSSPSAPVIARPVPAPPSAAPGGLIAGTVQNTNVSLSWSAVSGAVGYVIHRATSLGGPYSYLTSVTETTYTDVGINPAVTYYYQVAAVNAAGVSGTTTVSSLAAPTSLAAIPGNAQVTLIWPAVSGATGYLIKRGTSSGNETTTVVSGYPGTAYTNTSLVNGTTYYYVVAAQKSAGTGPNSPEASTTPGTAPPSGLRWIGNVSGDWDTTTTNWLNGATPAVYSDGAGVTFDNSGASTTVVISNAVYPAAVTFANASVNYSLGASGSGITGPAGLEKTNSGTVTLTSANAYTGGTVIDGGSITLPGANGSAAFTQAIGSGTVTMDPGGELQFAPPGGSAGRTSSTFTNNFVLNGGLLYANDGQEHLTGTVVVSAASTLLRQWDNKTADQVKGLLLDGVLSGSAALNLYGTAGSVNEGARIWIDNSANTYAGTITAYPGAALSGFSAPAGGFSLGIGANAALQFATVNVEGTRPSGATDSSDAYGLQFLGGVTAPVLGALAGSGNINLDTFATVAPVALTVGGNGTNTTFSGILSSTTGAGSLTKSGAGTLTVSGANTYTGGTTITGGTLLANNTTGSATGSGAVTVASGGALGGTGTISGAVTVNSGGTLAPGSPAQPLNLASTLTLAAGSAALFQVSHSPFANTQVAVGGPVTEGGTLAVTNTSANPLAAGDRFTLIKTAAYNGAFAAFNLPPLNSNLAWNTTRVPVDGSLWVLSTAPPVFNAPSLTSGGLVVSGSGGTPNWNYLVLSSTNITLPPSEWTVLATNAFDASGDYAFTNPIDPTLGQTYLRLQVQ